MSTICYGILVARNCIILFTVFCFVLVVLLLRMYYTFEALYYG